MKIQPLILLTILFSCEAKTENKTSSVIKPEDPVQEIVIENRSFAVGDINHDQISDTAFVNYKWNVETNEIVCGKAMCDIYVEFKKDIPAISCAQSMGVVVQKAEDLNRDGANEIILFSRTHEGWWNEIAIWSFKNGIWNEIAKTEGFIAVDPDFENRIVKEKGKYYLIGQDKWEEDENGDFKIIKVRI